jgi:hypothetical protein
MAKVTATSSGPNGGDWFEIAAKVRVQVLDRDQLIKAAIAEAQSRAHDSEEGEATVAEIQSDLTEAIIELVDPIVLTGKLPGAEPSDGQVSVGLCAPFQPSVSA